MYSCECSHMIIIIISWAVVFAVRRMNGKTKVAFLANYESGKDKTFFC